MKHYRLTLWITHGDTAAALSVDTYATTPGRAVDQALDKYRLPASAVIGWHRITKHTTTQKAEQ